MKFYNTQSIPSKVTADRKSLPNLNWELLIKKGQLDKKEEDTEYDPNELKMGIEIEKEHEDLYNYFVDFLKKNNLEMPLTLDEFAEKISKKHLSELHDYNTRLKKMEADAKPTEGQEKEAQTSLNLVDRSAPSVDHDRIPMKDRLKHRVRFRNEPNGIQEQMKEGLDGYKNTYRPDSENGPNDPGDPRRGY
jgi:hypothetical protein